MIVLPNSHIMVKEKESVKEKTRENRVVLVQRRWDNTQCLLQGQQRVRARSHKLNSRLHHEEDR